MVRIRPNNEILTFSLNAEDLTKLSVAQKEIIICIYSLAQDIV